MYHSTWMRTAEEYTGGILLGTSHNLSSRGGGGGAVEEKLFFIPNYFQTPTNSIHVF